MKTQLKKNERVVLTIRKHWFVLLKPLLWTVFLIIVAIALAVITTDSNPEYRKKFIIGTGLTILMSILWFIYKVFDRKTNLWAVTNLRIIDEYGVFTNNSKETPLDKINNVSFRQPILGRVFNYGDVQIQSAAESGSTYHKMVARPKILKDSITEQQDQNRQEHIKEHAKSLANIVKEQTPSSKHVITEELTKLHELKVKGIITEDEFVKMKGKILND